MNEKIAEMIAKLPVELQILATEHIPALQTMALNEIIAMITALVNGNTVEAYKVIASKMSNDALALEITDLASDVQAANEANAASISKQKNVLIAVLTTALGILVNL
jgi:hypothetical protein